MSLANVKKYVELRIAALAAITGPAARDAHRKVEELKMVLGEIERYYKKSPEQIKGEQAEFLRKERARVKHEEEKKAKMDEIRARKAEREMAEEKKELAAKKNPAKKDETATEEEPHDAPPG